MYLMFIGSKPISFAATASIATWSSDARITFFTSGFITRGRGVSIHRADCNNILQLEDNEPGRIIAVDWSGRTAQIYPVDILIEAYDRSGLMRDVAALVADEHINMVSVEAITGQKDNLAIINATLEIQNASQLTRILTKIDRLPNVVEARRRLH